MPHERMPPADGHSMWFLLVVSLVLAGGSCRLFTDPSSRRIVRLTLDPDSVALYVGDTAWITANAYDLWGRVTPDADVTWKRSAEYIVELAPVGRTGRARGMGPGTMMVIAESDGAADSAIVSVVAAPVTFREVAAGSYTCGIGQDGKAYCWGLQYLGRYPAGGWYAGPTYSPVAVPGGPSFSSSEVGHQHACGLRVSGEVFCWGLNAHGELGSGDSSSSTVPVAVAGGQKFSALAVGDFHACGLTTEGQAYCWGSDLYGQLGAGAPAEQCANEPCRRIPVPVTGALVFRSITAGVLHTCGITVAGDTYCWGLNDDYQLGTVSSVDSCVDSFSSHRCSRVPVRVSGGVQFELLSASLNHTCGLTSDGSAYCWGANQVGQLGTGGTPPTSASPIPVSGSLTFVGLESGGAHSCALANDGLGYCWGANSYGQTGANSSEACVDDNVTVPCNKQPVAVLGGVVFASVTAGGAHSCGVALTGIAYCWGSNFIGGELGNGDGRIKNSATPLQVYGSTP